ncbi:tetratricopeptide repeat protein [Streptomyces sp. NBC_00828]|uniref:tetratricopeptide repeat protein n=1 Tax=Streptomyces sp. NBC_00828 TaxID=2903678 RepID=UPI003866952D
MPDQNGPDRIRQRAIASGQAMVNQIAGDLNINLYAPGSGPTPQALSALPAAPAYLVGRQAQTDELLALLDPAGQGPSVTAVAGLAGVGKTALALHGAHRAVADGWFPGGVLFVSLHGYDPAGPVTAGQALGALLRALGIRHEDLPPTPDELASWYQSALARCSEQAGPVLVVADDASTAGQVLPLIPAHRGHRLLVTSRHTLGAGGRLVDLGVLAPADSVALLRMALRHARGDAETRVDDAPEPARQIAELCGHLPLALQICAALAADIPARPLTWLVQALHDAHRRLNRLQREERGVRAAFDLSYQHLDDQHARLFRLLSLNPGPDLATAAAACLADTDPIAAEDLLHHLNRAHLIESSGPGGERWRLHDLVRLYAADQLDHDGTDDVAAAFARLLEHYRTTAAAADSHLGPRADSPPSPVFARREDALDWLEEERANLVATVTSASGTGAAATAASLAFSLATFFEQRRYLADWTTVTAIALAVLQQASDHQSAARALCNLGIAQRELRQFDVAVVLLRTAASAFAESGDRRAHAMALDMLGATWREMRQFDESITAHTQAAATFRETQDLHGEARALNNLGATCREMQRSDKALPALQEAVDIMRSVGDRRGEAASLANLGAALREAGQFEEAITQYRDAIAGFREAHDRHGEALALHNRGDALQQAGRFHEAIEDHTKAVAFFQDAEDRHRHAIALSSLAEALSEAHQHAEAVEVSDQAVEIRRQLAQADPGPDAPELARTLCLAAQVRRNGQHDLATALSMVEEGTGIYRDLVTEAATVFNAHFHMALQLQADVLDLLGYPQQAEAIRGSA